MIYFSNPGSFDIRLLSIFGVSAKPNSSNPIGKFGTGLKNAVAGVLRLGGTVTIHSDGKEYTIFSRRESFRGQDHDMVYMLGEEEVPLSFSLSLGQHWEPWMIYREFYCNAKDEGGPKPSLSYPKGDVVFCISCPAIEAILDQHSTFFIEGKPIATIGNLEIFPGTTSKAYYKGVAVFKSDKPFLFTYNFLSGLSLTEDRTVDSWGIRYNLSTNLSRAEGPDRLLLKSILLATEANMEYFIDLENIWSPSEAFKEEVCALARANRASLVPSGQRWAKRNAPGDITIQTVPFSREQELALAAAKLKLRLTLGLEYNYPTFLSPEVSDNQQGMVVGGKVYLNANAFVNERELYCTLLEEHIHIASGAADFTREFQEELHKVIQVLAFGKEQTLAFAFDRAIADAEAVP